MRESDDQHFVGRLGGRVGPSFESAGHNVAAILSRTEHGNLHAGLVFRRHGSIGYLHLAWEDRLVDEWDWKDGVWVSPQIEPERLTSIAAMCRRVWKTFCANRRFPYALRFNDSSFDGGGRLRLGARAQGLTCATFILAVFNSVGVSLVEEQTWPQRREEDEAFLEFLASYASIEHMNILRREVEDGVKRIWPDEVLGACKTPRIPAAFAAARSAANEILKLLDESPLD